MTSVRAQCPDCGDVRLRIDDLTVRSCLDAFGTDGYRFTCPSCDDVVVRDASPRIVELLLSAGAHHETWRVPAELQERRVGPVLTIDDLLDFHELLEGEGWFDQVTALVQRTTPE